MTAKRNAKPTQAQNGCGKETYAWLSLTQQNASIHLAGLVALAKQIQATGDMVLFAQVRDAFVYSSKRILYRQADKKAMVENGIAYFESVLPSVKAQPKAQPTATEGILAGIDPAVIQAIVKSLGITPGSVAPAPSVTTTPAPSVSSAIEQFNAKMLEKKKHTA